jgi:hypothetical protein
MWALSHTHQRRKKEEAWAKKKNSEFLTTQHLLPKGQKHGSWDNFPVLGTAQPHVCPVASDCPENCHQASLIQHWQEVLG